MDFRAFIESELSSNLGDMMRIFNLRDEVWEDVIKNQTMMLANIALDGFVLGPTAVQILSRPVIKTIFDPKTKKASQKQVVKCKIKANENEFNLRKEKDGYGQYDKIADKILDLPLEDLIGFGFGGGQAGGAPPMGAPPGGGLGGM